MKINNKLKPLFFIPVTVLYLIFFYNEYIFQIVEQAEIKNSLCSSWKNTESLIYNLSKDNFCQRDSISFSQAVEQESLAISHSPRCPRQTLPTLGPSGKLERLNC